MLTFKWRNMKLLSKCNVINICYVINLLQCAICTFSLIFFIIIKHDMLSLNTQLQTRILNDCLKQKNTRNLGLFIVLDDFDKIAALVFNFFSHESDQMLCRVLSHATHWTSAWNTAMYHKQRPRTNWTEVLQKLTGPRSLKRFDTLCRPVCNIPMWFR